MINVRNHFVLFVVDDPASCRDFYLSHLEFEVELDVGWYVVLTSGGEGGLGLAFLQSGHPTQPQHHHQPVSGTRFVTLEVDDVDVVAARLVRLGAPIDVSLRDEPWGQRHIIVRDPAGNGVDIVTQIEPDPEFAERWFSAA